MVPDNGRPPAAWILGTRVDVTSYPDATRRILGWAAEGVSRYVVAANVHVVMEAHDSPAVHAAVAGAALVTPDGMPLVWTLRAAGYVQDRVYGPDLMLHVCDAAAHDGVPIGLYGGSPATLDRLQAQLARRFPGLRLAYAHAPPFRPLSAAEDAEDADAIRVSGARILFVGLGCPRQELWMAEHADRVPAVMLGVGAAFDFHAGTVRQAPPLLQQAGLEWAFRLAMEPRRLWRRYLLHNPRFVARLVSDALARP